jgi:hypothetical protein
VRIVSLLGWTAVCDDCNARAAGTVLRGDSGLAVATGNDERERAEFSRTAPTQLAAVTCTRPAQLACH